MVIISLYSNHNLLFYTCVKHTQIQTCMLAVAVSTSLICERGHFAQESNLSFLTVFYHLFAYHHFFLPTIIFCIKYACCLLIWNCGRMLLYCAQQVHTCTKKDVIIHTHVQKNNFVRISHAAHVFDFFNRQLVESQYLNDEDSNCLAHTPEPKGAIPYWQWQKLGTKNMNALCGRCMNCSMEQ